MSEKIEFGEPEKLQNGKVRYQKSHRKNRWKSPVFGQDSRRNKAEAWSLFVVWRETIDDQMQRHQEISDSDHPVRKKIIAELQDYQGLCETANLDKHAIAAKSLIEKVRQFDTTNLIEFSEIYEAGKTKETQQQFMQEVATKKKKHIKTSELIDEWLQYRLIDVKTGDLSAGGFVNIKRQTERWDKFCPNILNATALKVAEYKAELQLSDMTKTAQRDYLSTAKSFLEWCIDTAEVIPPIKSLRKKGSGISVSKKKTITIWEDTDILDLFSVVQGPQKLHLMLMLNTGAYESDIGTWKKTSIDQNGKLYTTFDRHKKTIRFKRHKEKDIETVPTVTYRLWDITYQLLCKYEANHSTLLFTTSTNTSLWSRSLVDGKLKAKSTIGKNYRKLRFTLKKENWGTLDDLRKTAISKLHSHTGQYAKFAQYFAGHSPENVTNAFYAKPSQSEFDNAVIWLGQQFGIS